MNESARRSHLPVQLEPTITAFCLAMVLGLSYDLGGLYAEPGSLQPVFSLGVVLMGLDG